MALVKDKMYYTYNDVTIVPSIISNIEHRSECIPWDEDGMLPLFTAPMNTVVSEDNFKLFEENHINAILPRTAPLDTRKFYSTKGRWAAYSLKEFSDVFCNEDDKLPTTHKLKALIDVANGHMKIIFDLARKARRIYGNDIILMGGNIANPKTYEEYARAGFDYVRCSVGTGCCCISSSQLGVHFPMASLIDEIATLKKEIEEDYRYLPKIIADGGVRNYRDIIKALALGADYVMVGSVFAKMEESAAPKETDEEGNLVATFYGMASREGQIALNGAKTKTSEGIKKKLLVEYTMEGWTKNFIDYLRSAMSYVGYKSLDSFRKYTTVIINSPNAVCAVNN